jgi:hypothetical protein
MIRGRCGGAGEDGDRRAASGAGMRAPAEDHVARNVDPLVVEGGKRIGDSLNPSIGHACPVVPRDATDSGMPSVFQWQQDVEKIDDELTLIS